MATPRTPQTRRARTAAASPRAIPAIRRRGVRRAHPGRAQSDRRARPETHGANARGLDPAGSADRAARRRRRDQPRNRRTTIHQRQHRRLPPPQGFPQARGDVPYPDCTPPRRAKRTSRPRRLRRRAFVTGDSNRVLTTACGQTSTGGARSMRDGAAARAPRLLFRGTMGAGPREPTAGGVHLNIDRRLPSARVLGMVDDDAPLAFKRFAATSVTILRSLSRLAIESRSTR